MTKHLEMITQELNPSSFRYMQLFDEQHIEAIIQRSGIAHYLTFGRIEEALQVGFTITQKDSIAAEEAEDEEAAFEDEQTFEEAAFGNATETEEEVIEAETEEVPKVTSSEHPRNQEIQDDVYFSTRMESIVKARGNRSAYGFVCMAKLEGADEIDKLIYSNWENTKLEYPTKEEDAEESEEVNDITELESAEMTISNSSGSKDTHTFDGDDSTFRLSGNTTKKAGVFRSDLSKSLDDLFGLINVGQQIGLLVIRIGSLIRKATVPASVLTDAKHSGLKTELMKQLDDIGMNSRLLWPREIQGVELSIELLGAEGTLAPFMDAYNILLANVAAAHGIPIEALKGSELGLRSAETNREAFFVTLQKEQEAAKRDIKWMLENFYDLQEGTYDIQFDAFKEMNEKEIIELKILKFDGLSKAIPNMERLGIEASSLLEYFEIDIEVNEQLIAENKAKREQMTQGLMQSQNNNSDSSDDGDESEDTESQKPPGEEDEI